MNENEIKNVYDVFTAVWKLFKKYANVRTDAEWESLVAEADRIARQHGNGQLIRDLILAIIKELERAGKELRQ